MNVSGTWNTHFRLEPEPGSGSGLGTGPGQDTVVEEGSVHYTATPEGALCIHVDSAILCSLPDPRLWLIHWYSRGIGLEGAYLLMVTSHKSLHVRRLRGVAGAGVVGLHA